MIGTKAITIHEGEKIRWTANDKQRGLHNSALGRVLAIDDKGITIETADRNVVRLAKGDPMLRRLDLAYTLNMHMAQGVTTDKAMIVMGSEERLLANQRLFNVGVTRARDGVSVITDDKDKLTRQLDRTPGDKLSALEVTGQVAQDRANGASRQPEIDLGPIPKGAFADMARKISPISPAEQSFAPGAMPVLPSAPIQQKGPGEGAKAPAKIPQIAVPEKTKGLEL